MSVIAFTGLDGSGKSYGVVEHVILPAIRANRTVVTNVALRRDVIYHDFPKADVRMIWDLDEYADGSKFFALPPGVVIVLDEVWRIWPAGIKAHEAPKGAKEFLYEHRHLVGDDGYSTEIVLVTQDLAQIANFARLMVKKTMIATKLTAVGAENRFRVDMYSGAVCGHRGPQDRILGQSVSHYNEGVWRYYKSHTKGDGVGKEIQADQRGVIWRRPIFVLGMPFAVLAILFAAFTFQRFFQRMGEEDELPVVEAPAMPPVYHLSSVPGLVVPAAVGREVDLGVSSGPRLSARWRLQAVIQSGSGGLAQVVDGSGNVRPVAIEDCRRLDLPGIHFECLVDGELVTGYSGQVRQTSSLFAKQDDEKKTD